MTNFSICDSEVTEVEVDGDGDVKESTDEPTAKSVKPSASLSKWKCD